MNVEAAPPLREQSPIRVGIVGAGRGGSALLDVLLRVPLVQVAAVCDINPDAPALAAARRRAIPVYHDSQRLVREVSLDWLFNVSHASITQRHLVSRNLEGLTVVDGATAELIWKVLVDADCYLNELEGLTCDVEAANACLTPLVWSLIHHIVESQQQLQEELNAIAFRDPLTGLYSRRVLMDSLERELQSARRHGHEMSLLMIDLDRFKAINDEHGHDAGDEALCAVARVLEKCGRGSDLPARLGGEEFVVILPFNGPEEALATAERVREMISCDIPRPEGGPLTASIGVVTFHPETPESGTLTGMELLARADRALYAAKEGGRDQVVVFGEADSG
jgi:diguanylate cyclase (GGDEF)-like protein